MDLSEHGTPWLFPPLKQSYPLLMPQYRYSQYHREGSRQPHVTWRGSWCSKHASLVSALYIKLGWRLGLRDLARLACIGSSFPPRFVRDDERTCMLHVRWQGTHARAHSLLWVTGADRVQHEPSLRHLPCLACSMPACLMVLPHALIMHFKCWREAYLAVGMTSLEASPS